MPALRVVEPGMFTTVQDLGRPGRGASGVPPSGAADAISLIVGNRLLRNPENAAALEYTLLGPSVTLDRDTSICLTGAECPRARIGTSHGERPLRPCEPTRVRAGELIKIGGTSGGARGYLCVAGGFDVPTVLGSRSTLASASLGGHEGRALRAGDAIPLHDAIRADRETSAELHAWLAARLARRVIRLVPSLHAGEFPPSALETLESARWTATDRADRVGVRLDGPRIPIPERVNELESEPAITGGVQIPGDALPIILGVDRPATGGYPLLACAIEADLPALAMLRPRDTLRFEVVTLEAARQIRAAQQRELDAFLPPTNKEPVA